MIDLPNWASANNFKIAWGNIQCLSDALHEFEILSYIGRLNDLQNNKFNAWTSSSPRRNVKMKTVILIAYPVSGKSRRILFNLNGLEVATLLPPCYGDDGQSLQFEMVLAQSFTDYLGEYGYKVERLAGPYKNLAARLGLGKYGRNNLIYVRGFGSYLRIVGFISDAELTPEFFPGPNAGKQLENCMKCSLCKDSCPTQAIGDDRFPLHVDRCLAYQNERVAEWPDFVRYAKNSCLVGCLICQNICPFNKDFIHVGATLSACFDRKETAYILGSGGIHERATEQHVYQKLAKLGLGRYNKFIVRNLQAYIHLTKGVSY